jgi:hypothetical protein
MKKSKQIKLTLNKQVVMELTKNNQIEVQGGAWYSKNGCNPPTFSKKCTSFYC